MTTTIQVEREMRDWIATFGKAGDSLNDALENIKIVMDGIEITDAVAPESWAGVAKFIDIGEHRFWLMVDGSVVEPST
jgi:hypothetical protein